MTKLESGYLCPICGEDMKPKGDKNGMLRFIHEKCNSDWLLLRSPIK